MKMKTVKKRKKGYLEVVIPKSALKYGKRYGVTKAEARKAWISGFMKSARKQRKKKYKGAKGFDFLEY